MTDNTCGHPMEAVFFDDQGKKLCGWCDDLSQTKKQLAQAQAEAAALREALAWYGEHAEALQRYYNAKPPKDDAMLAVVTTLQLDGGARAKKAPSPAVARIMGYEKALQEIAGSGPVDQDGNEDAYAGWAWCYERAEAALKEQGDG